MESVKVVERQGKGRSLVAARSFEVGEVALISEALKVSVFPSKASSFCAYCLRRQPLLTCQRCNLFGYCSQECCEADASDHSVECGAIDFLSMGLRAAGDAVWHGGDALLDALLLGRLVRAQLPADSAAAHLASPFTGKPFALHAALSTPALMIPKTISESLLAAAAEFPGLLPKSWVKHRHGASACLQGQDNCIDKLVAFLVQIQCNACGVIEINEFEAVGEGLFVEASLANHDCSPNCQFTFHWQSERSRPQVHVQCIQAVAAGEDLTISYRDVARPVWERRKRLQCSHWFTCRCGRCERELSSQGLPTQARLVADAQGRVLRALLARTVSDTKEQAMVMDALHAVGVNSSTAATEARIEAAFVEVAEEAAQTEASSDMTRTGARAALRKILRALGNVLEIVHPEAVVVFELRQLALSRARAAGDASVVAEMTQELIATCEHVYPNLDKRRYALLDVRRQALKELNRDSEAAAVAAQAREFCERLGLSVPEAAKCEVEQLPKVDAEDVLSHPQNLGAAISQAVWSPVGESNSGSVCTAVELPETVASMADVELDISSDVVRIAILNKGLLNEFSTPFAVDVPNAQAVFSRRSRMLKVIVSPTGS